jgi:hypothetical protein
MAYQNLRYREEVKMKQVKVSEKTHQMLLWLKLKNHKKSIEEVVSMLMEKEYQNLKSFKDKEL